MSRFLVWSIVAVGLGIQLGGVSPVWAETPREWVQANIEPLSQLYRHFHEHPELSLHEEKTAARLAEELRAIGCEVTTGVGGHGVVGVLANGEGPKVMLRTDLDALPVVEETNLAFASKVKFRRDDGSETGVMHACGHDLHMTNLIGVGRYLAATKDQWKGTIIFLGQPAEELVIGAKAMLEDGLFERFPKPDFAVALHVDAGLAAGKIGVRPGYTLANSDSIDIVVYGKGGHGAYPHTTVDPIVQAAELILALQTIVSREIEPTEPAVVTVGSIHGGTKHNIIADSCKLQLTIRSYSDEVRSQILAAIERKAKAAAASAGAPAPEITISGTVPSVWNDPKLADRLREVFEVSIGKENVLEAEQSMGGEDFSHYGRAGVPIVMYRLGVVEPARQARYEELGQQPPSLHSALFYPDLERALETGIATMSAAALELLGKP